MNPYLKLTLRTFTIWILASFINGLFCTVYISLIARYGAELAGDTIIDGAFYNAVTFFERRKKDILNEQMNYMWLSWNVADEYIKKS